MSFVYVNGVQFDVSEHYKLKEFFKDIIPSKQNFTEIKTKFAKHLMSVNMRGKYCAGLVLVDTEQASMVTTEIDGGKLKPKVLKNAGGAKRSEFIFFVLNTDSNRGLFTQYRGSGGAGVLRGILVKPYAEQARTKRSRMDDLESDKSESLRTAKMLVSNLAPNHDFAAEIERMTRYLAFDFVVPKLSTTKGGRLSKYVKSERHELRFKDDSQKLKELGKQISSMVKSEQIEKGKVYGQDAHGVGMEVPIDPDAVKFGKLNFNDVAVQGNFNVDDLFSTNVVGSLISIMEKNKLLFGG